MKLHKGDDLSLKITLTGLVEIDKALAGHDSEDLSGHLSAIARRAVDKELTKIRCGKAKVRLKTAQDVFGDRNDYRY